MTVEILHRVGHVVSAQAPPVVADRARSRFGG